VINCRPISLLASFSKIFEKIIFIKVFKHLNVHNILAYEQFDIGEHSSTEKLKYKLFKKTLNAINNKSMIGGIFCDL
jgi:hypothetical protein